MSIAEAETLSVAPQEDSCPPAPMTAACTQEGAEDMLQGLRSPLDLTEASPPSL